MYCLKSTTQLTMVTKKEAEDDTEFNDCNSHLYLLNFKHWCYFCYMILKSQKSTSHSGQFRFLQSTATSNRRVKMLQQALCGNEPKILTWFFKVCCLLF